MKEGRKIEENSEYIKWSLKEQTRQGWLDIEWVSLDFRRSIFRGNFLPVAINSLSRKEKKLDGGISKYEATCQGHEL